VLLVPQPEEEENSTTLPFTAATTIKTEFFPLTPSNTPQYSISRGETPSPPNAQRYSSGGLDMGGLTRRLSPVPKTFSAALSTDRKPKDEASPAVLVQSLESGSKVEVMFPLISCPKKSSLRAVVFNKINIAYCGGL
jgi:hypothetical protein